MFRAVPEEFYIQVRKHSVFHNYSRFPSVHYWGLPTEYSPRKYLTSTIRICLTSGSPHSAATQQCLQAASTWQFTERLSNSLTIKISEIIYNATRLPSKCLQCHRVFIMPRSGVVLNTTQHSHGAAGSCTYTRARVYVFWRLQTCYG